MATVGTAAVCTATRASAATAVLLSMLASDDAFRAEFEASPADALGALGVSAELPDGPVRLPAKEELGALLADAVRRGTLRDACEGAPFSHKC